MLKSPVVTCVHITLNTNPWVAEYNSVFTQRITSVYSIQGNSKHSDFQTSPDDASARGGFSHPYSVICLPEGSCTGCNHLSWETQAGHGANDHRQEPCCPSRNSGHGAARQDLPPAKNSSEMAVPLMAAGVSVVKRPFC